MTAPSKRDMDALLKRTDALARKARTLGPESTRAERMQAMANLTEGLNALEQMKEQVQTQIGKVQRGRTVNAAYGQAARLGQPERRSRKPGS